MLQYFLKFSFGNQVWRDGHEEYVRSIEQAHKGVIASVVFDGGWLYSGSWDSSIKVCPFTRHTAKEDVGHLLIQMQDCWREFPLLHFYQQVFLKNVQAWPIEEVLSADAFSHVQRTCGATVTALACTHEKLYASVAHTIQVWSTPLLQANVFEMLHCFSNSL